MNRAVRRMRSREEVPDLVGSVVLVALGLAFAGGSVQYGIYAEGGRLGPGFMPFVAGSLLVVFGATVGVEALLRRRRGVATSSASMPPPDREGGQDGRTRHSVPLLFGLTLAAVALIPVLGFLLAFGLLVFALVVFVERFEAMVGLGMGVGAVFLAWLVFALFLRIPLPAGLFGSLFGAGG